MTMYYRAPDDSIHYLDDPAFRDLLPLGSVQITDAEAAATRRPDPSEVIADYTGAIQRHIDAVAQSWGYDSVYTAATYADEPAAPEFQREGRALRAWRSRVWAAARQTLADVQGGKTPLPTVADLIASLPAAPTKG